MIAAVLWAAALVPGVAGIEVADASCNAVGQLRVSGRVRAPAGAASATPILVRVAVHGDMHEAWRVPEASSPVNLRGSTWVRWQLEVTDAVCGEPSPRSGALAALVVTAGQSLSISGSVDMAALRGNVWAVSPPRSLPPRRFPAFDPVGDRIEIDSIETSQGRAPVDPARRDPYAVPQVILLAGRVTRRKGGMVQVMVHPLPGNEVWVMGSVGDVSRGTWTAQAQFGRDGIDNFIHFEVTALLVDRRLPTRKLTREELEGLRPHIRASSAHVLVLRNDPPIDPARDVRIAVTNVDRQRITPVDSLEEWTTGTTTLLRGQILGRPINTGEQVYVCVRDVGRGDAESTCKRGIVDGHGYWEMLPWSLGAPGGRVIVTALLATRPVDPERENDRGAIRAQSRPLQLQIADPIFRIDALGGKPVQAGGESRPISSSSLSDVRGTRDQSVPEARVWIFKRPLGAAGRWTALGVAVGMSLGRWQLHPTEIGKPGERVLLIGVLARQPPRELDVTDTGPNVLALTPAITVEVAP